MCECLQQNDRSGKNMLVNCSCSPEMPYKLIHAAIIHNNLVCIHRWDG